MDFKELLETYKKGEATPEQVRLVEEEIEKNKLINDYICGEMDMDPPASEVETTGKPDKESYKAVKKIMRRTLLKVGAIAAAIVLIALLAAEYIVSPLVASRYYNPGKIVIDEAQSERPYPITQGALDKMVSYELMYYPAVITDVIVEDKGYGKYYIQTGTFDLFDLEYQYRQDTLTRGQQDKQYWSNSAVFHYFHEGVHELSRRDFYDDMEKLEQLPKDAVIEAAVLFTETHTMQELLELMDDCSSLFFEWAAVCNTYFQPEPDKYYVGLLGFRPVYIPSSLRIPPSVDIGYPYLSLPEDEPITAEILEQHFISLLTYNCDRAEYMDHVFSNNPDVGELTQDWHANTLKKVQKTGVETYGAVVTGSPQDILSLYEDGIATGIEIYDMKSSVYENEIY